MSANIPETMLLKDLLKATGYDCPEALQDKTFAEATQGDTPSFLYYWGRGNGEMLTNFSPDSFVEEDAAWLAYSSGSIIKRKFSDAYTSATIEGNTLTVTNASHQSFEYTYDASKNIAIW